MTSESIEISGKSTICIYEPTIYEYFKQDEVTAGGAERQLYLLSDYLKNKADLVFIVHDYGQPKTIQKNSIRFYSVHKPHKEDDPIIRLQQIRSIYQGLRQSNPDIVLCRGAITPPILVQRIAGHLDARFIYNLANDKDITKDYENSNILTKYLFKRMLQKADAIISQNKIQANILEQRFGQSSKIIPNGYPPSETKKSAPGDYFLWVGRLEQSQKQPHRYLELASQLPEQEFLLIGPHVADQSYRNSLEKRIEELDNVRYIGPVSPNNVHKYYERAIALVNTSRYEGFPNTYLEAWRKAVPVVALHIDPNRFLNNQSSIGFSNGDLEELASLCRRLEKNPQLQQEEGERGYEQFLSEYTMSEVANEYINTISDIL